MKITQAVSISFKSVASDMRISFCVLSVNPVLIRLSIALFFKEENSD